MNKDVSIVLVNYNTAQMTKECIESIYKQTFDLNYEIIVVDNASDDFSCEVISNNFPDVKLIRSSVNLGFGKANNLAVENSNSKYLLFLNTDTVLKNNAIRILFDFMQNNNQVGACGGNLYNKEGEHTISYFYAASLKQKFLRTFHLLNFSPEEKRKVLDKGHNQNNECKEVEVISGADLMVRKSVIDKVGGFDKDFFLYFEETELEYRIRNAGYKIFIVPDSQIYHLEGATTNKNRKSRRYEFLKGEYLYLKKTSGKSKLIFIRFLCMASHLLRLFSSPKMILKLWKYIWTN